MWRYRIKKVLCCFTIVAVIYFIILSVTLLLQESSCDYYGSQGVIEETCSNYTLNRVGGSLCEDLCEKQLISYQGCVHHKLERSVLFMNYVNSGVEPRTVVLKTQRKIVNIDVDDVKISDEMLMKKMEGNIVPLICKQTGRMYDQLNASVLTDLWGYNFTKYVNGFHEKSAALRSALRSIWFVVQQREYVVMRLNQHMKAIPRIYGTCGALFVMEYANAISTLKTGLSEGRRVSIHLSPWKPRAEYAIKILEMLPSLDTEFSEPLHLCDLKDPNIGMREDGEIALIDLDHAILESELSKKFKNQTCSEDLTCGFPKINCPGMCDRDIHKCKSGRTNNHLQTVCERIFLNKVGWINTGLLRSPPYEIADELMHLLYKCAYPPSGISPIASNRNLYNTITGNSQRVIHKPGDDQRKRLIEIINKGISL